MPDVRRVYMDCAATSFPKSRRAAEAAMNATLNLYGNPSRTYSDSPSGAIFDAREKMAEFLGATDSSDVIFTSGATHSANVAVFGTLSKGDHAIASSMEHNAVMRPLIRLRDQGVIELTIVPAEGGKISPGAIAREKRPNTRLIACLHGSNVTGAVYSPEEIAEIKDGALLLCDASQTAGILDLKPEKSGIDLLIFSGHKSLGAPFGTGVLYRSKRAEIRPLIYGGTGANSELDDMPGFYPDRLEAGTCNACGIAGIAEAAKEFMESPPSIADLMEKTLFLEERLRRTGRLEVFSGTGGGVFLPTISVAPKGMSVSDFAFELKRRGVTARAGLHCAPYAHRSIGTFPAGTVRLSFGKDTTAEDLEFAAEAAEEAAGGAGRP